MFSNQSRYWFILMLALLITSTGALACSDDTDESTDGNTDVGIDEEPITPFSLTALVNDTEVKDVLDALATYLHEVDDTDNGLISDWLIIGGSELKDDAPLAEAALNLPGGDKIVEVCNHHYAEQAMSFGDFHGVALPCEISLHQNGDDVEVFILNPEAIFQVFFGDVPAEYADNMKGLAAAVRSELEGIIEASVTDFDAITPKEDLGPEWFAKDLATFQEMEYSIKREVTIPSDYTSDDDTRQEYKELVVAKIIELLTHEDMDTVGSTVDGLSVDDWHSARTFAPTLPGKVSVVEVCSSTYATAAISTGAHHGPALPCQMAIYVQDDSIIVDVLDPLFIFPVFFSDVSEDMAENMGPLATAVQTDILLMVDAAIAAM